MNTDEIIAYCIRTGSSLKELRNLIRGCVKFNKADESFCLLTLANIKAMNPPRPMYRELTQKEAA